MNSELQSVALTWERRDSLALAAFVALALVLYFFRLSEPPRYIYDEAYHAYTAAQLVQGNARAYWFDVPADGYISATNQRAYTTWTHPPLARDIMQIGIWLCGDTPMGWRTMSAIFGSLGVGLIFLFGRSWLNYKTGVFAAALLLLDGLWFVQARTGMLDIFISGFLLAAYFTFLLYLQRADASRRKYLVMCGAMLGLALATKWSAAYSFVFLAVWSLWREWKIEKSLRMFLLWIAAFAIIPISEYLLSYSQFFAMGYSIFDWLQLQQKMWAYHSTLQAQHPWASPWWSWPLMLKPVWYHAGATPNKIEQIFAMGNPAIWWLSVPAALFLSWKWKLKKFHPAWGLMLLGFWGNWLPWALSPRIAFIYHFLPSVPFACLAISFLLCRMEAKKMRGIVAAYGIMVVAMFVYFYPQFSAYRVTREYSNSHYWLPSWKPENPDPAAK